MEFASPLAWWLVLPAVAAIGAAAYFSYRRPLVPLTPGQRAVLTTLRALALLLLLALISRPVWLLPPDTSGDVVIPVLVDVSRSMAIADVDGRSRASEAKRLLDDRLVPGLKGSVQIDILRVADGAEATTPEGLGADGSRSRLSAAIAAVSDRYRGRRVPGLVLISDGGDTGAGADAAAVTSAPLPVFAVGVGSVEGPADREVLSIAAGDPRLARASIDLHVSAVAHGHGRDPFTLRVLANGQLYEARQVTPSADGAPVSETFTVSPDLDRPSVYTAQVAGDGVDAIAENDTRSVLVSPAGRKRRVLVLAGAPGYEHSFLLRAISQDAGLDVDSVVRKGKNDTGVDTFLVQAAGGRVQSLISGFPSTRESLFEYDAIVVANLESEFFSRAQLELLAAFVGERGGGLLLLGGRSFERRGLIGTPMEEVLPLELNDRHGGPLRESGDEGGGRDKVQLTGEGERHPIMRFAQDPAETRRLWSTLPPLAANAPVGGPRPGASVLATLTGGNGPAPLIAVQRYARGRSMIFAGEASWQWRMMTAATDHRYETFWQQAVRWLSADAPERVSIDAAADAEPGDNVELTIDARDRSYAPVPGATLTLSVTPLSGQSEPLVLRRTTGGASVATFAAKDAGAYRVQGTAARGSEALGEAERWLYVGGGNREMSEPRLNEAFLQRLARQTGGAYVRAGEIDSVVAKLASAAPANLAPVRRELWHEPWTIIAMMMLLAAEWGLRRMWGLR